MPVKMLNIISTTEKRILDRACILIRQKKEPTMRCAVGVETQTIVAIDGMGLAGFKCFILHSAIFCRMSVLNLAANIP